MHKLDRGDFLKAATLPAARRCCRPADRVRVPARRRVRAQPPPISSEPGKPLDPGVGWVRGGRHAQGQNYMTVPGKAYTEQVRRHRASRTPTSSTTARHCRRPAGRTSTSCTRATRTRRTTCREASCSRGTPACCRASRSSTRIWSTRAKVNGEQYMIPWDWGYASLTYNSEHVDAADATGWELAWNPKYSGKIALWNGAASNLEVAALKLGFPHMDNDDRRPADPGQPDADRPEAAEQVLLGRASTATCSRR